MALSVDQKSFAEFLPQELIGKRKRCSRRSSFEDAADAPRLSNALLNLILLDTESDFWYQAKGQSGFFLQRVVTTFGMEFKVGKTEDA